MRRKLKEGPLKALIHFFVSNDRLINQKRGLILTLQQINALEMRTRVLNNGKIKADTTDNLAKLLCLKCLKRIFLITRIK